MARSSFGRSHADSPWVCSGFATRWDRLRASSLAPFCRAVTVGDWPEVSRATELLAVSLTPETLRVASGEMGEQFAPAPALGGSAVGQGYGHISSKCSGCRSGLASRRRVWRPGRVGGRLSP